MCCLSLDSIENLHYVALDETMIQLDEHHYWLYTAVDPQTNNIIHVQLYSTTTTALTERFFHELTENHDLDDAVFLVDGAKHLQTAPVELGSDFDTKNMEIETPLNMSFVR